MGWFSPLLAQVSLQDLQARAEQGDVEAMHVLANALVNGQGVPRDVEQALRYYETAAAANHVPSAFNLALLYEIGLGVEQDLSRAFGYYQKAAELGMPVAQFNVGNMYARGLGTPADLGAANRWFERAAEAGIPDAQHRMGETYEQGLGVERDPTEAARWYQQAVQQNFPRSAYNLAQLYESGQGVARDLAEAVRLYRLAAEQNYGPAQNKLAQFYVTGEGGVAVSPPDAYAWFVLAAENGANPRGRDLLAQQMDRVQLAEADIVLLSLRNRLGLEPRAEAPSVTTAAEPSPDTSSDQPQLAARITELEAELIRLQRENTGLVATNDSLARDLRDLQARTVQLAPQTGTRRAERKRIDELRDQLTELATADPAQADLYREVTRALGRLSDDVMVLDRDVKKSTLELSRLSLKLRRAEDALPAARREAETLREQLAQARTRIETLEAQAADAAALQIRVDELTAMQGELAARLAAKEDRPVAPAADRTAQAQDEEILLRFRSEVARQEKELKTRALEIEAQQLQIEELTAALQILRERLREAEK